MFSLFIVLGCLFASAFADDKDVLVFTNDNFETEVKNYEVLLLEFYAPWCGHCKKLAPNYEEAATKLKKNDSPIHLGKVDCTTEKAVCDKFSVSGFPTLKIFRNGQYSQDYEGPRDTSGIVKYMRGQAGPAAVEVKSVTQFNKAVSGDDTVIFGFFESESKLKDSFLKVADTERDRYQFMYTASNELIEKFGHKDDIVAFVPKYLKNNFDPEYFLYDGNYDTDKIKEFLLHETIGLAGVRTMENIHQFDQKPLFVVYSKLDYKLDPKGSNYWRNRVLKVAQNYKLKAHFAVSNREDFSHEIKQYGLEERQDKAPSVVAQTKDGKFAMEKEFSVDNLKRFVDDVLEGNLQPFVKSEPIPETQDDVKVVVGKTLSEFMREDKDMLIEFYAPWCGHCKSLAPKYDELAKKLSNEPGVIIAKMDATANDVLPSFDVKGFPTIYWVPKGSKDKPELYEGKREVDDFIKFIAKHSTDELEGYGRDGKPKKANEEL